MVIAAIRSNPARGGRRRWLSVGFTAYCLWVQTACSGPVEETPAELLKGVDTTSAVSPVLAEAPTPLDAGDGFVGVVLARQSVDVAAELEGQLQAVYVQIGARVEPGDRIAAVETRELAEQLEMAQAAVRALEPEQQQAAIDMDIVQERLKRRRSLAGIYSREEVAALQAEEQRAAAVLEAAKSQVDRARAFLRQLNSRLRYAVINSPIAGTVAVRYLDPGALVRPGVPVVRLLGTGAFVARFAVPPARAGELASGQEISFHIAALEARLAGVITYISPQVDLASEMVFVEADLMIPEGWSNRLRAGMAGNVQVDLKLAD